MTKDPGGNVVQGDGPVILQETRNSFAFSDQLCVALVGVEDLVVVAMEDAVLVAGKDRAEEIRRLVGHLKGTVERSRSSTIASTGPGAGTSGSTAAAATMSNASW
jgi:hypothetical protein